MLSRYKNTKEIVGKIFESRNYGKFEIISYVNFSNVEIKFIDTGYKCFVQMGDIERGNVKDRFAPSICGFGIIGEKYENCILVDGKRKTSPQYSIWCSMINRCYNEKFLLKHPTYKGCVVSKNFQHYDYFYEWCNEQFGFGSEGWELDKDLLVKGNNLYSEDTCVFLPKELNLLLSKRGNYRGGDLIGVCYRRKTGKFLSQMSEGGGKRRYIGSFDTIYLRLQHPYLS